MTVSLVLMKCDCLVLKYRHSLTYAVVMFRKVWYMSHFAKFGVEYTYGQICLYIEGSPVEIQTPGFKILIGRNMTALPPVLCQAIFFCHLCLIALAFTQAEIQPAF